ncbi:harbinger transposase-derived nuclease domain-containing protein [Artemisia annua]|uniref:Harbinger transposase-derived nuclease domain-containing protein n=1 Tax=Artemisia annua TaxID=35608 RepID=A0A2U1Q1Q7_ARTAN|nr:harbinger transposase-derived nuclease domain-containing protein [Artemisia annua]
MDDDLYVMAKKHLLVTVYGASLVVVFIAYRRLHNRNRDNAPTRDMMLHRQQVREDMMHNLITSGKCRQLIRMSENAFKTLCQKLQSDVGLRPTQRITVEEQVARFLHVVGNDFRNHFASWCYRRSGSATSRHFHRGFDTIISLEDHYIQQPTGKFYLVDGGLPHRRIDSKLLRGILFNIMTYFEVLSLSGFSWNPVPKLMDAKEEVWEALIKFAYFSLSHTLIGLKYNKPEASKWRKKPMNHYNELFELFAKDRANGDAAETAKERNNRMKNNEQRVETIDEIDQLL